jgi:S-formylglutathione hydrolase FrmB
MKVHCDTPHLLVTSITGSNKVAKVVFRGAATRNDPHDQTDIDSQQPTIFYVLDRDNAWYALCHHELLALLTKELSGFETISTLGESMGGYGALLFAGMIPKCTRAFAFAPQYSIKPELIAFDTRAPRYRQAMYTRIPEWPHETSLCSIRPRVQYMLFYGGDSFDIQHAQKILSNRTQLGNVTVVFVPAAPHNVQKFLRDKGVMKELWRILLTGTRIDTAAVANILSQGRIQHSIASI